MVNASWMTINQLTRLHHIVWLYDCITYRWYHLDWTGWDVLLADSGCLGVTNVLFYCWLVQYGPISTNSYPVSTHERRQIVQMCLANPVVGQCFFGQHMLSPPKTCCSNTRSAAGQNMCLVLQFQRRWNFDCQALSLYGSDLFLVWRPGGAHSPRVCKAGRGTWIFQKWN